MEHNKDEIKVVNNPPYDKGFRNWQIHAEFKYRNAKLRLCDTISGCGPVQMYQYTSTYSFNEEIKDEFIFLFKTIMEDAIKADISRNNTSKWFHRAPTAIMFVQGLYNEDYYNNDNDDYEYDEENLSPNSINFINMMTELGFEHKIYQNIAHGLDTRDIQGFFYLDVKEKYIKKQI